MKPHDSAPPTDALPETNTPGVDADDGGAGRVPFAVAEGDFSTPARRRRTITRPRGLRTLEAPAPELIHDATETAPVPAPNVQALEGDGGLSPVEEFLTSPPTPVPEIALTPLPETDPAPGTHSLAELLAGADLAPTGTGHAAAEALSLPTPLPESRAGRGAAPGSRYATQELEQLEIEETDSVVGATPQPEVAPSADARSADGNTVTPAPEDVEHLQRDLRAHFRATENAEAELEAAVNAGIPTSDTRHAAVPEEGPVPVIENAAAGAEMRLAALGSLPVAREPAGDADQLSRDEAIVDDLLRRATEQMLNGAEAPHVELPAGALVEEIEPQTAAEEVTELPLDAAGAAFGALPEEATAEELDVSEATEEPTSGPISEPSLSPLAQTLANMAEALHSDLDTEGGVEIDIVDAPLIGKPRSATPGEQGGPSPALSPAVPPPIPAKAATPARGMPEQSPADLAAVPEALEERPRRPRRSKPWYEEVFDENYLRTLPFMTPEQTLREVDFIENSLSPEKGARVLDVGCGYGRHSIELVQRGLAVTGLDLSLPLLIRAADEAQKRALSVNFVHSDMRGLAFDREFDSAYCMLTSFGYFDEETNAKVAEGMARALKPGGRLLLDVVNRDYIVSDLPARIWWEGDGCVVLEEVEFNFNTSRILTHRSVVFEDGRQLDQEISVRAYSLHELGRVLRQAGFRVLEVSGSIFTPGRFFGASSRNLIILAERRRD